MNSLKEYFDREKNRSRSVSDDELRRFLMANANDSVRSNTTERETKWRIRMKILMVLSVALFIGSFVPQVRSGCNSEPEDSVADIAEQHPKGASVFYFSDCPLDNSWGYDVGESQFAPALVVEQPMLELTESELRTLGIELREEGDVYIYVERANGREKSMVALTPNDVDMRPLPDLLPEGIVSNGEYPALATDRLGRRRFAHFNFHEVDSALNAQIQAIYTWTWEKYGHLNDEGRGEDYQRLVKETGVDTLKEKLHAKAEREFQELDRMIPILIPSDQFSAVQDSLKGECSRTIILWYRQSEELLKKLPSDWRERMRRVGSIHSRSKIPSEIGGEQRESGRNQQIGAEQPMEKQPQKATRQGEKPKAVQNSDPSIASDPVAGSMERVPLVENPGAIVSGNVYPMPVQEIGNLQLQLSEARTVAVSLHSLAGKRLALLLGDTFMGEGEHLFPLYFSEVPPGLYLLALSTNRGELRLVRVIVE